MTPRVMGLDLSLTACGVAGMDGVTHVLKTTLRGVERLAYLEDAVFSHAQAADVVILENYGYLQGAALGVLEAHGVIKLMLWNAHIPFVLVAPAQLKKFATDRGGANKVEMIVAARERFGYEGTDDNEADALLLRAMGLLHYDLGERASLAYQRAVVAKIAWPELREDVSA